MIAWSYFEDYTNYWVDSRLISDSKTKTTVFQAVETVYNLEKGLFTQDAALTLFYSHLVFVYTFH